MDNIVSKIYCKRVRMLMLSENFKPDQLTVARVRCKQWSCPACARRNINMWRLHLLKTLSKPEFADQKWCFITITVPPELHGQSVQSVGRLQKTWKRFYDWLRRKFKRVLSYVYMYEAHTDQTYHLHAIINIGEEYDSYPLIVVWKRPLEHHPLHRWMQDKLPTIGAGWKCGIQRVYPMYGLNSTVSAILYAIKYMSKSGSWVGFKKHARRIGTTSDIGSPPKPVAQDFLWLPVREISLRDLAKWGIIEDVSIGRELKRADFEYGFYPPMHEEE